MTVLITGATSGLGLAAAVHFANLGANLVLTARSIANGHTAAEQVEACAGIGKYIQSLFTEDEYRRLSAPCLRSQTALKVREIVWKEIITDLIEKVPVLQGLKVAVAGH
ncbi:hypothetical protein AtubIFM57258_011225 [Aspergillus tubingensis]|nr:hypothetical protein AtubIFM57258_011225 [Aspergillus tubingensis]